MREVRGLARTTQISPFVDGKVLDALDAGVEAGLVELVLATARWSRRGWKFLLEHRISLETFPANDGLL
jgi:hypothetical protein